MAIWLGGLGLITWVFFRDGGFTQFAPFLELCALALFWLFGWAGANYAFSMPLTYVTLNNGIVHVRQRWLLRRSEESFAINSLTTPEIQQSRHSDGDAYYKLVLTAGGRDIVLNESADRSSLDALRDRLISEAHFES